MKRRLRFPLIGILMTLIFMATPVVAGSHTSCNCWDGDFICVTHDENHNITGWILHQGGC